MGTDYTTHLGPYLECRTNKVEKEYKIRSCTNKSCKKHGDEYWADYKFCEECGSKIDKITLTRKENAVNCAQVKQEIKEALYNGMGDALADWSRENDTDIWLPNRHRPDKRSRDFSFDPREDIQIIDITAQDALEEITEFARQYEKEIKILFTHYGQSHVNLKWGLIHLIH